MTRLDERIADAERKRSLVERYAPVVDAAGYLDGTLELTPEECFLLALSIIHDKKSPGSAGTRGGPAPRVTTSVPSNRSATTNVPLCAPA
jgi:hypothetical protein